MATDKQKLGEWGEILVTKENSCPQCKKEKTLKRLPTNFKCADLICDFCGFLGQVKSKNVTDIDIIPDKILGAAWSVQKERMDAGKYFPLFLVLKGPKTKKSIWYLSSDLQVEEMFEPRKPLSPNARRAGWQGYYFNFKKYKSRFVRLI